MVRVDLGTMKQLEYGLVWTADKLVLGPNVFLEQPKSMRHPATEFVFCHFGQKVISCTLGRVLGLEVFWHAC